ncbi:MAG TPA: hypothetical protein VG722_12925, partial [Tepidisphaeraceae bacterium]|nr:hypothetical protein [Tepidisphaeraceae bacterium]
IQSALSHIFDDDRVRSFIFRVENEQALTAKALQEPIWGWGGWGRSLIYDQDGKDTSITDSLWIIALGEYGLVGLVSLYTALLLPATLAWYRYPPQRTSDIRLISLHLMSLLQILFAIDCLSNAMINPIYLLAMGGVTSLLMRPARQTINETRRDGIMGAPTPSVRRLVIKPHRP